MTALFSAAARAAHLVVDSEPFLLADPDAYRLLAPQSPSPLDYQLAQPAAPLLAAARVSACTRSRFADDALGPRPSTQVLVLGGGLDTTANRFPGLSVWLVDLPGVLTWRADLFAAARLADAARLVPMNLADGLDMAALATQGFDAAAPATVLWLGVSMYLEANECAHLCAELAQLAPGSRLVFDYIGPASLRDARGTEYACAVANMAGRSGEPWTFTPSRGEIRRLLADAGWTVARDLAESEVVEDEFWQRQAHLRAMQLVRLVDATLTGS